MNETLFLQAKSLYDGGEYQQSISAFRQVLQEAPEYLDARRFLASALLRSRSYSATIREIEILLHTSTPDAWTYHELGAAQVGKKHWDQAISAYRNALLLDPSYRNSHMVLVWR